MSDTHSRRAVGSSPPLGPKKGKGGLVALMLFGVFALGGAGYYLWNSQVAEPKRKAACFAVSDAVKNGRRISSLDPQYVEWLLGPGAWTQQDIRHLESHMQSEAMLRDVVNSPDRYPPEFVTKTTEEWKTKYRFLLDISSLIGGGRLDAAKDKLWNRGQ